MGVHFKSIAAFNYALMFGIKVAFILYSIVQYLSIWVGVSQRNHCVARYHLLHVMLFSKYRVHTNIATSINEG